MFDLWYGLVDFFTKIYKSQDFKTSVEVFRFLFIVITITFIVLAIWLKAKAGFFAEKFLYYSFYFSKEKKPEETSVLPLKELKDYWKELGLRLNTEDEAQWKLMVIGADNFFDHVLTLLGYQGESMGERLQKILPVHLPSINEVWRVHKIRNSLVHDSSFKLTKNQTKDVYETYEKALKELKIFE